MRVVEHGRVVGDDPHLEIAPPVALRAEPGAGEVRAAEVERGAVDGDDLEVNARASPHREAALREPGMTGELGPERAGRDAGVQQAKLDAARRLTVEHVEDRLVAAARLRSRADRRLDAHLLHVRGGDPQRDLRPRQHRTHEVAVVIAVGQHLRANRPRGRCFNEGEPLGQGTCIFAPPPSSGQIPR